MNILIVFLLASVNPGFDFLRIASTPMGVDVYNSVWTNPALLTMDGNFAGFNYTSWLLDEGIYSIYAKKGSWGVHFRYFNMGEVEYQDERPRDDLMIKFVPYASELTLMKGFQIDEETAFGIGVTGFLSRLYAHTATGYTISAGLFYAPKKLKHLAISAYIKDFGFKKAYIGQPINMPTEANAAVQYVFRNKFTLGYRWRKVLTFKADSSYTIGATNTIYGKFQFNDVSIFASYETGKSVVPFEIGLSYSVKNKIQFYYIYRHGFYGFNSPYITGIQMEF